MTTAAGDIAITRPDGLLASYAVPGQPERLVALKRRDLTELISEELRRMDADQVYERAVKALLSEAKHDRRRAGDRGARERRRGGRSPGRAAAGPARRDPAGLPGAPGGAHRRSDRHQGLPAARRRGSSFRGRLVPGRPLVGRRAVGARGRQRPQCRADAGPAGRTAATDSRPGAQDAGQRRRSRSGSGRRGLRPDPGRDRLRHLPAGSGTGRPCGLDLSRASVVVRSRAT